ncbi:hypothetical protein HHO41_14845 [Bacillus sp. DNRA2]|uniref:hypothetical protein n=1 Tax=Bacillus sp. DNRA2 TaxID=2723053 RepID=UPI00145D3964|nr:hypothetical protein [Bacillus sp. DNRA2]NMD71578.1 hypothetical protein [Bacillus sp. DNRA2]
MGSSKEIFLKVDEFDAELKALEGSVTSISKVKSDDIKNVNKKVILESMDIMHSIITTFTSSIEAYVKLSKKDIKEAESMKEKWITKDNELANSIKGGK